MSPSAPINSTTADLASATFSIRHVSGSLKAAGSPSTSATWPSMWISRVCAATRARAKCVACARPFVELLGLVLHPLHDCHVGRDIAHEVDAQFRQGYCDLPLSTSSGPCAGLLQQ